MTLLDASNISQRADITSDPGRGTIEFSRVGARTVVTAARASSPLRFLTPSNHGDAAWLFTSNFGGGIIAGDHLHISATLHPHASAFIGTQSSTKIYRCLNDLPCRQTFHADLAEDSLLAVIPDPVNCFANALYEQRQQFDLAPTANLAVLDWLVSGRYARGERWAFTRYRSRNDIRRNGTLLLTDPISLASTGAPLSALQHMGQCECLGTIILLGPKFASAASQIATSIAAAPLERNASLLISCSPLEEGIILRFAARETTFATAFVNHTLEFLKEHFGECPWTRKA